MARKQRKMSQYLIEEREKLFGKEEPVKPKRKSQEELDKIVAIEYDYRIVGQGIAEEGKIGLTLGEMTVIALFDVAFEKLMKKAEELGISKEGWQDWEISKFDGLTVVGYTRRNRKHSVDLEITEIRG